MRTADGWVDYCMRHQKTFSADLVKEIQVDALRSLETLVLCSAPPDVRSLIESRLTEAVSDLSLPSTPGMYDSYRMRNVVIWGKEIDMEELSLSKDKTEYLVR